MSIEQTMILIDEFEREFWPNVPNKIGKGQARKAYCMARRKASKQTILDGLPGYKAWEEGRKKKSGYIPLHPATWLNGERWEDEIVTKEEDRFDRIKKKEQEGIL